MSATDPEARVMKMADGGFRPAFNVQLVVDKQTQLIAGIEVVDQGTDMGQMRRGLYGFNVRDKPKARAVVLWHALAHNLMRMRSLGTAWSI